MKPLSSLSLKAARSVRVVLTDIDDTVTTEGVLTGKTYGALEDLHCAGFIVIPVTGRPAGWCDHIARMWPVDAVVEKNGALFLRYDRARTNIQAVAHRLTHRPAYITQGHSGDGFAEVEDLLLKTRSKEIV